MSKKGKILFLVSGISVLILFTARFIVQGWADFMFVPMATAILAFVGAFFADYKFYLEFLSMKTTKHGMNMGVLILLAFFLAVAVNYLGVKFNKTFDLTKEKINTLSDQSINLVKGLKSEMHVMIFYKNKPLKERAQEIKSDFAMYESESKLVKVDVFDSNFDVEMSKKYLQNSEAFAAILDFNGKRVVIQPQAGDPSRPVFLESDITSAMMKVTRDKPMSIYFLTGHGEKDTELQALDGLKLFSETLKDDGYTVAKLNVLTGDKMPDLSSVLAIIGPKSALTENELKQIKDFTSQGGRVLLAIDPGEKHQLALLTKTWGVEFANNYVLNEVVGSDDGVAGVVGIEFSPTHEITKKLPRGSLALFPYASELKKAADASAENTYVELVKSHAKSFISDHPNNYSKDPERKAHVLAMAVKGSKLNVIVFGDSDFLSDFRIRGFSHIDLAMNSVAYLFNDTANVTIRPKKLESTHLQITENRRVFIVIAGVSLPLLLIAMSGVFWYRRRNL